MIFQDLIDYFKSLIDFSEIEKIFPDGKGIYSLFEIDLSENRNNKEYFFNGDQLIVINCDNQVYLRLNSVENDLIDLLIVRSINTPYKKFYITNTASSGYLKILVGSGGIFNCSGNITVDLNAQTIQRIEIRDHDGGIESSTEASANVPPGNWATLHSYSGKGSFRYIVFRTTAHADSHLLDYLIYIDDVNIEPTFSTADLNALGFNANSKPLQLLKYAVDGVIVIVWYFEKGIVFDSKIEFKCHNDSGTETLITQALWFYQKIV